MTTEIDARLTGGMEVEDVTGSSFEVGGLSSLEGLGFAGCVSGGDGAGVFFGGSLTGGFDAGGGGSGAFVVAGGGGGGGFVLAAGGRVTMVVMVGGGGWVTETVALPSCLGNRCRCSRKSPRCHMVVSN